MNNALFSLSNKKGLKKVSTFLLNKDWRILSSSGTYNKIGNFKNLVKIEDFTSYPEILNGRVKTLHPKIFGGILTNKKFKKIEDIDKIKLVSVNLYPFQEAIEEDNSLENAIENIDIGGEALLRAAAKNFEDVVVICDPDDYKLIYENYDSLYGSNGFELRKDLAQKAFEHVIEYNINIAKYFNNNLEYRKYCKVEDLSKGTNPHQKGYGIYKINKQDVPYKILNGSPSYINILDAGYSWNLMCDLKKINPKQIAFTSYKHNSPAGASFYSKLNESDNKKFMVPKNCHGEYYSMGGVGSAYLKSRNCDPLSSFGDFIATNSIVDVETAQLIKNDVSGGIIAPAYQKEALNILKNKKGGRYVILKGNETYYKDEMREIGGLALKQEKDNYLTGIDISITNKKMSDDILKDIQLANTVLKYTQSNSVAICYNGQVIGIGAGQQNRVECIKIAVKKLHNWILRELPEVNIISEMKIKKVNKINKMYDIIDNLDEEIKMEFIDKWVKNNGDKLVLASDGFFPFTDSIELCRKYGIKNIIQPGGSINDNLIIDKCNDEGISMILTGKRIFTH